MNCDKCHELLSDFLDGTMVEDDRSLLSAHLDECLSCACVREEINAVVGLAHESRNAYAAPPNEQALWLRIRNTIEAELEAEQRWQTVTQDTAHERQKSFLSGWLNRRWSMSLSQLTTTVAAIAVGVSLATTYGVRQLSNDDQPIVVVRDTPPRLNPDQTFAIDYLKQRVDQRKARWNPEMRAAFDRNLSVIDATVSECLTTLDQTPHDEISEEALNMALQDKMELLKEFSEL